MCTLGAGPARTSQRRICEPRKWAARAAGRPSLWLLPRAESGVQARRAAARRTSAHAAQANLRRSLSAGRAHSPPPACRPRVLLCSLPYAAALWAALAQAGVSAGLHCAGRSTGSVVKLPSLTLSPASLAYQAEMVGPFIDRLSHRPLFGARQTESRRCLPSSRRPLIVRHSSSSRSPSGGGHLFTLCEPL